MSMKRAILCGAIAASIGTTAFAQSGYDDRYRSGPPDDRYGNGPQESTPAEMQQTDQLNQQAGDVAQSDSAMQAQYQSQYQDQQQQYNDQIQNYQAQQDRYGYDRDRYNAYLSAYGRAGYYWGYPYADGYPYPYPYPGPYIVYP